MSLIDDVKLVLSMPENLPVMMSRISVAVDFLPGPTAEGAPQERLEAFEFEIEALNDLLGVGFCQHGGAGQAVAQLTAENQLSLSIEGEALSPVMVALAVRLLVNLTHAPYHPAMEITGATPSLFRDTVARLTVQVLASATANSSLEVASYSGLVPLPYDSAARGLPVEMQDAANAPLFHAETLELPRRAMPSESVDDALMTLCESFVPPGSAGEVEHEFFAKGSSVILRDFHADTGLVPYIIALFPAQGG